MLLEMQFEALLTKDRQPAKVVEQQFVPVKNVSKNLKYAQKYGGQDETDSDSSKDLIVPPDVVKPEAKPAGKRDYSDI